MIGNKKTLTMMAWAEWHGLTSDADDMDNGLLSEKSALGKAILGAEEGDEIDIEFEGRKRNILIDAVEPSSDKADDGSGLS